MRYVAGRRRRDAKPKPRTRAEKKAFREAWDARYEEGVRRSSRA